MFTSRNAGQRPSEANEGIGLANCIAVTVIRLSSQQHTTTMTSTTSRNAIILVIVVALANYSTKIVGVVEGGSISEDVEMQRNLHVLTGWQSQSNYYEPYYYYSGWLC